MPRFEVPCFQTRVFKTGVKVASNGIEDPT